MDLTLTNATNICAFHCQILHHAIYEFTMAAETWIFMLVFFNFFINFSFFLIKCQISKQSSAFASVLSSTCSMSWYSFSEFSADFRHAWMTKNSESQASQRLWLSMETSFAAFMHSARLIAFGTELTILVVDAGANASVIWTDSCLILFNSCWCAYHQPLLVLSVSLLYLLSTNFRMPSCISSGTCGP